MNNKINLPSLPYNEWTETRLTLHLILQIIGKSRLKTTHRKNHWWYITIYVSARGFSTHAIPVDNGLNSFQVEIDIPKKAVVLTKSTGEEQLISLATNISVADFYSMYMKTLNNWGLDPKFINKPLDLGIDKSFDEIDEYHHYDWDYIQRFWEVMRWNNDVLQEFSGRFYGKSCPVHIYWHHMDLTVTRFSGKKLPPMPPEARILEKESYSHEQISFGFWIGDDNMTEPAYYSYTYPAPDNLDKEKLGSDKATWIDANGSPMAILKYEDIRQMDNPRAELLNFLESAYQAGAKLANWDVEELTVPALSEL